MNVIKAIGIFNAIKTGQFISRKQNLFRSNAQGSSSILCSRAHFDNCESVERA